MSTQVVCAACGKGGDNLKVCTSCEQVSYCNAKCRKAHRSKHKKECRQYTAAIYDGKVAARKKVDAIIEKFSKIEISDKELFVDPPQKEDCDICFLPIPHTSGICGVYTVYQPCCGKTICNGCMVSAKLEMDKGNLKECCPFCRMPLHTSNEELVQRVKKRLKVNDHEAFYMLAGGYYNGSMGLNQDFSEAIRLLYIGAELGSISAHSALAEACQYGNGTEVDLKRATIHLQLAAIGGDVLARRHLGANESNFERAYKHFMIAAKSGDDESLEEVGEGYKAGHITKDEYASTLRAHQQSWGGMRSEQRSNASKYPDIIRTYGDEIPYD